MTGRHTRLIVLTVLATVVLSTAACAPQDPLPQEPPPNELINQEPSSRELPQEGQEPPPNELINQEPSSRELTLEGIDRSPLHTAGVQDERVCGDLVLRLEKLENLDIYLEAWEAGVEGNGELVYREEVGDTFAWFSPTAINVPQGFDTTGLMWNPYNRILSMTRYDRGSDSPPFDFPSPEIVPLDFPKSVPLRFCEDITGNGFPNVVFTVHSGGSAGYGSTHIIEIHPEFIIREVFTSKGADPPSYPIYDVVDLDGDGVMELVDRSHYYFDSVHKLDQPSPIVVLSWTGSIYALDLDLTRRLPSPEGYRITVEELRRIWSPFVEDEETQQEGTDTFAPWSPRDFAAKRGRFARAGTWRSVWKLYNPAIDLIYSGNWDTAWKLLDDVLPTRWRGTAKEELLSNIIGDGYYGLEVLAKYADASTVAATQSR